MDYAPGRVQMAERMSKQNQVLSEAASIRIAPKASPDSPPVVHRETLLKDLPDRGQHQYVLVCNGDEKIVGLVPTKEIDRRLLSGNRFERTRWSEMPIGALSRLPLSETSPAPFTPSGTELPCSTIREGNDLFGFSINGDVFLSWNRLEALFTAALSDPLTGLMNRLAFERRLSEEWSRSGRIGNSIGVVVIDLDKFKAVNDTFGHPAGDELLKRVGQELEAAMRSYDVVARFGGDEFVALCLGCGPNNIQIPIARLQEGLSRIEIEFEGVQVTARGSIGAAVRHSEFKKSSPEELFSAADNCLYEAKKKRGSARKIEFGCAGAEQDTEVAVTSVSTELLTSELAPLF